MRYLSFVAAFCCGLLCCVWSASAAPRLADRTADVRGGVLRWQDDGAEVRLFGVNYYPPFSIDYEALKARGLDPETAIREDLAHFVRLGLTAIRLHCWDRQISDREGNLVDNEHLRLLDFLIAEAARRGIYSVMTPIAWWGAPQPGGFSDLYSMPQMTTDAGARAAQCRYLGQYLAHVNRYTGKAYRDDPAIIALELINEPLYPADAPDEQVTAYIDALCKAVRDTGCRKPVFYNCWAGRAAAAAASTLDGVTFGWYPTGLVNGSMLKGNYLAAVADYPAMRDPRLAAKAKIVYEFDAADVHQSVMYPAMARAFRRGGAQIATQFQYEPLCIAAGNPNWQTHYLNLVYTPAKALSFAIAAEVMRRLDGPNPTADLPGLRIDYGQDLSELATEDIFLYSNDTTTRPPAPERLTRLAGVGSSPLVEHAGTGAYFLDRLAPGVWKLQVYPDAVVVADPYSGGSKEKVRLVNCTWPLRVRLPDLGEDFRVVRCEGDRPDRSEARAASAGAFTTGPGQWLLVAAGKTIPTEALGVEFVSPPVAAAAPAALVEAPAAWREGKPLTVRASVAAAPATRCVLHYRPAGAAAFTPLPMAQERPFRYSVAVPAELLRPGKADYYLAFHEGQATTVCPTGADASAAAPPLPPLALLAIRREAPLPKASYSGPEGLAGRCGLVPGREADSVALALSADGFGEAPSCVGTELPVTAAPPDAGRYNAVTFLVRGDGGTSAAEISLVQKDGNAFGYDVPLAPVWREVTVPLERLKPVWSTRTTRPDLSQLQQVKIITGAWLLGGSSKRPHEVQVQNVLLTRQAPFWRVDVAGREAPVVLWEGAEAPPHTSGRAASVTVVAGSRPDRSAVRIAVPGFGPPPDAVSLRRSVSDVVASCREELTRGSYVQVVARAGQPTTRALEMVLIEQDGSPWGTMEVALSEQWREIRIPLQKLRYFDHWKVGPTDRGRAGDQMHLDRVAALNLCFGSWLLPDSYAGPQAVEIESVSVGWQE